MINGELKLIVGFHLPSGKAGPWGVFYSAAHPGGLFLQTREVPVNKKKIHLWGGNLGEAVSGAPVSGGTGREKKTKKKKKKRKQKQKKKTKKKKQTKPSKTVKLCGEVLNPGPMDKLVC